MRRDSSGGGTAAARRTAWPWLTVAVGVLILAQAAATSSDSALVALGGGFIAAQLAVPTLVERWRLTGPRPARPTVPAERPFVNREYIGRRGPDAGGWARLDVNRPWRSAENAAEA